MLKILGVIAGSYALLVVLVYLMQGRMLYLPDMPDRELTATPADIGLVWEDVWTETADGVRIHGWFVPGRTDKVLLFFHGNAGNISHRLASIRQFHELGLAVHIIDYRGYGRSGGRITEQGSYRDADAAWRHLTGERGYAPDDVVVFGRSLGASVAARLASQQRPHALIVESSFTSVPDIAQELYPWLPARWLTRLRHSTRDFVAQVESPVLVIHSRDDEIIPYHHGQAIFEAASEPKTLLTIGGTHNDGFIRDEDVYLQGIRGFLDDAASGLRVDRRLR